MRRASAARAARAAGAALPADKYDKLIIHLSNFRPVKRVDAVVEIFERVHREGAGEADLRG